ncbi:MAG TPA: hypothetical protein PKJ33_00390 [Alphaproteobacteria bacterium]|nr:hypothetical protein [Alphaproteobacteria bacterium]
MKKKLLISFFTIFIIALYSKAASAAVTYCIVDTVYTSCDAGYYLSGGVCSVCPTDTYKDTISAAGSCTSCPYLQDVQGHTSGTSYTNHDSITDCFVLSGTTFSDTSGSYSFTSNCYYSN